MDNNLNLFIRSFRNELTEEDKAKIAEAEAAKAEEKASAETTEAESKA